MNLHLAADCDNSGQTIEWWRGQLILAAELLADEIERQPAECVSRETLVAVAMLGRRREALAGARQ